MTTDAEGDTKLEDLFAEQEQEQEQQAAEPAANPEEDSQDPGSEPEIPEKYRGKSAMDIIRMHQDAEKLLGRQGNELGQLRAVADDLLKAASASAPTDTASQEPETDFFADPQKATQDTVTKVLENDPRIQALSEEAIENRKERAGRALLQAHPDAKEISESPEFGQWLSESPVRVQMFEQAHKNFDPALATELMTLYKDTKRVTTETANNAQEQRQTDVAKASAGAGKSGTEARAKPIFSRERLIELKIKDPTRYYANIDQFKEAYRDGRVR